MAFGTQDETDEVMNEINMTPLVDVMLVLLIIFIITVPVMKHAINIDLPRATNVPQDPKPETVRLSVDAQGSYYWNENRIEEKALVPMLRTEALGPAVARVQMIERLHLGGPVLQQMERPAPEQPLMDEALGESSAPALPLNVCAFSPEEYLLQCNF